MDFSVFAQELHDQLFDPARLPVAVAALLIVSLIGILTGPLGGNAEPLFWQILNALFGRIGKKLDKKGRGQRDLLSRGMFFTLLIVVIAFFIGSGLQFASIAHPNFSIVDVLALSVLMSAGVGWFALIRLYKAMHGKTLVKGAFYALATTTRTDLTTADEFTMTRLGIATGARLFDKAAVAPILWYLIGGLPVAFLYAGLSCLAWRYGKEGFNKGFGDLALALEKLMGFVPNAFSGLLISLAGLLTPTAGMTRSLVGLMHFGKSGRAGYYQGGAVITAMAYALNVSLGGPTQDIDGTVIRRDWAGPGKATARLESGHLRRGVYILVIAHMLFLGSLLSAILFAGGVTPFGLFFQ